MKLRREHARIASVDFQWIPIGQKRRAELTRTRFCTRVQRAYTYTYGPLGRYSRVRDAHDPQGRAMLHRELRYVYAHSSHCAPFSRTLSFYLSLGFLLLFLSRSFSVAHVLFSRRTFFSLLLLILIFFLHRSSCAILHFRCNAHFLRGFLSYFGLSFLLCCDFREFIRAFGFSREIITPRRFTFMAIVINNWNSKSVRVI